MADPSPHSAFFPHQRLKSLAELARDRAWPAGTDRAAVAFDYRNQLRGRPGQEALFGLENIEAIHCPLDDRMPSRVRELDHGTARDAFQDARIDRGGVDL